MVFIEFSYPENHDLKLKVKGHAEKSGKGNDVVCAAVSALVQTLAAGVQKNLEAQVNGKLETGDCDLTIRVPKENQADAELVFKIFRYGFQKIAESYPEHVKLN
ncbi:MAG: ribosomal-processing cysteine protease Prp [Candidatus Rifleibacteriota bacterium]